MKRLFTLLTALMLATALCAPVLADDAAVTDPTPNPTPTPTASIDTSNSDGVYVSAYTVTNAAGGEVTTVEVGDRINLVLKVVDHASARYCVKPEEISARINSAVFTYTGTGEIGQLFDSNDDPNATRLQNVRNGSASPEEVAANAQYNYYSYVILFRDVIYNGGGNTYATMVTKQGLIKRTPLSQFRNIRKMGLIAIALNEGDSLVWSHLTKGDDEIIVATHDGAAIRFTEDGARSMGRTGHGVRVIKLREGDYVVGAGVCRPGANVLTISEEGKGRRSRIDDYRITKRGGLGIRNYSNGNVAGIKIVDDTDDLILISQNGILIRIHAADINVQSRYGSGVRVMRLVEDDKVAVVARVDRDNDAETAKIEDTGETDPTPEELAAIEAEELAQEAAEDAAPENDTEE